MDEGGSENRGQLRGRARAGAHGVSSEKKGDKIFSQSSGPLGASKASLFRDITEKERNRALEIGPLGLHLKKQH